MKVTTELKHIISRSFDEKLNKEYDELNTKIKKSISDKKDEVLATKEYKDYRKAADALYKKYEKEIQRDMKRYGKNNKPYRLDEMKFLLNDIGFFVGDNSYCYNEYGKEKNNIKDSLSKQKESLLIKLTYEKDLDRIKSLLSEYGIDI